MMGPDQSILKFAELATLRSKTIAACRIPSRLGSLTYLSSSDTLAAWRAHLLPCADLV